MLCNAKPELRSSTFNFCSNSIDAVVPDPTVDPATIISDQKSPLIKSFDEMKVIMALDPNQNDITDRQLLRFARCNRNPIAVIDLSLHRMTARPNLYRFTLL